MTTTLTNLESLRPFAPGLALGLTSIGVLLVTPCTLTMTVIEERASQRATRCASSDVMGSAPSS